MAIRLTSRQNRHHCITERASLAPERIDERKYILSVHRDQAPKEPRATEYAGIAGILLVFITRPANGSLAAPAVGSGADHSHACLE
jgi:hypothetical protein